MIDYAVDDCVDGGAPRMVVVVGPEDILLRNYLNRGGNYMTRLRSHDRDAYERLVRMHDGLTFEILEQSVGHGYGSAVPVMLSEMAVGDALLYYIAVDDLIISRRANSPLRLMRQFMQSTMVDAVVLAVRVPAEEASKYGILESCVEQNDVSLMLRIIEKPASVESRYPLAFGGRLLATGEFLATVRSLNAHPESGELRLTDSINDFVNEHRVGVLVSDAPYFNCGHPAGLLDANNFVASNREF